MVLSYAAPRFGTEAATLLAPLRSHPQAKILKLVPSLSQLSLPFERVALCQVYAFGWLAEYLVDRAADLANATLQYNLTPDATLILARYLLAAAQQVERYWRIAHMLRVPREHLPEKSAVQQLASRCRESVRNLQMDAPPTEVVLREFSSREQLLAHAKQVVAKMEKDYDFSRDSAGRMYDYDRIELTKPSLTALLDRIGQPMPDTAFKLNHSALYAQCYSFGITHGEMLAAYLLLYGKCPIDGKNLVLNPEVGTTSMTSRRISADRIFGTVGLHSLFSAIFISSEMNATRKARLEHHT